jgi:hypothetical protein
MNIAETLLRVNSDVLINALKKCGILRISFGCTGIDTPVSYLKDPARAKSKLQGFFPLPGENLNG